MKTNIKNLPDGKYFTEIGYSQKYPWAVISNTDKTFTLARVIVGPDPEWKPMFVSGGFCAHCTNQSEQTWMFARLDMADTITVRKTKNGWGHKGSRVVEDCAIEFYDYNF